MFGLPDDYIDASGGNPFFPFTSLFNYAAKQTHRQLTQYTPNLYRTDLSARYREALIPIHSYINQRGFKNPHYAGIGLSSLLMIDGGTTRAFEMLIRHLAHDVREWNRSIEHHNKTHNENNPHIRPVILMPVPTYGHFLWMLEHNQDINKTFEWVPVHRNPQDNWAVDTKHLQQTIIKLIKQGKRVVAYFDSNPNNPTGYVRDRAETERIGNLIEQLDAHYQQADQKSDEPVCFQDDLFSTMDALLEHRMRHSRVIWDGPSSHITIIDDMVYDGLQYSDSPYPCAFAQVMDEYKYCVTLMGPSKNGLASLRAGLIIGPSRTIDVLRNMDRDAGYCPSEMTMNILSGYFNSTDPQLVRMRQRYQDKALTYYDFSQMFLRALVNGYDDTERDMSPSHKRKIKQALSALSSGMQEKAHQLLKYGVRNQRIVTTPQSGFFHLLDSRGLIGQYFEVPKNDQTTPVPIENDAILHSVFEHNHLGTAGGPYMGLGLDHTLRRLNCAQTPDQLVQLAIRLDTISRQCHPA